MSNTNNLPSPAVRFNSFFPCAKEKLGSRARTLAVLLISALLTSCVSSPAAQAPDAAPTPIAATSPAVASSASASIDFAHPDRRCKVDADCAVKDVGNCCGAYPMCVNKGAAVDAKAVKAQCAREGRMGMCHVMAVSGCSCVQGQCEVANTARLPGTH
ncbi:MAG: hypothetical protein JSR34_02815 [Proteobacteria bacterium]|nr:hypothetical protein [Pseudomonadota bacterium]